MKTRKKIKEKVFNSLFLAAALSGFITLYLTSEYPIYYSMNHIYFTKEGFFMFLSFIVFAGFSIALYSKRVKKYISDYIWDMQTKKNTKS